MEIWRDIKGFEGLYQVSNQGNVRNVKRGKLLRKELTWRGYHRITLGSKGRKMLHRIVCEAFIPNPNNLPIINHINENKTDNRVENLEWCTQSHNVKHSYLNHKESWGNTGNRGRRNVLSKPCAKLKDGIVVAKYSGASEAERITGISRSSIIQVCNNSKVRKTAGGYEWKWL